MSSYKRSQKSVANYIKHKNKVKDSGFYSLKTESEKIVNDLLTRMNS